MLRCGAAKATITPPEWPVYLSGYGARLSTAAHDDVWATALYLEQGDEKFVVLTYDMISNSEEFIEEVQKACAAVTGLPAGALCELHRLGRGPDDESGKDMQKLITYANVLFFFFLSIFCFSPKTKNSFSFFLFFF